MQRVLMVGGTIGCALGTGYLMQNGADSLPFVGSGSHKSAELTRDETLARDDAVIGELQDIELTSAVPARGSNRSGATTALQARSGPLLPAPTRPEGCTVTASAAEAPMASVALSIDAPCHANQRLTIHHNGLVFANTTDESGGLEVTIPVLSENAIFLIAFADDTGAVAKTRVPDLDAFERIGMQWDGPAGFQLHAREFGADYGGTGHVSSDQTSSGLGQVIRLGDPDLPFARLAEIYTFPSQAAGQAGTITLTVEAEVTVENCGRDISAQSFDLRRDGGLRTRDLVLSMPECDAAGEFLVLNNLVQDLKIAAK